LVSVRTQFVEEWLVVLVKHEGIDSATLGAALPNFASSWCMKVRRISLEKYTCLGYWRVH
jgi:hypothetical protein